MWASEDMRLRYERLELYEIPSNVQLSNEFHKVSAILKDEMRHYIFQTLLEDYT